MYPFNRQPIPTVHVRAFKRKNETIPVTLGNQKAHEIQARFEIEVQDVRHSMTEAVPSGDIEERRRYLRRELFTWSLRRLRHDHNDKTFLAIMAVTLVIFVIGSGLTMPASARLMLNGLCFTTFTWVAFQILSLWFKAYQTASHPNPLQIEHPAIEAKGIEGQSGVGVIRPIEIKIAALKHLLAVESATSSPDKTN